MMIHQSYIGIDVSKAHLDIFDASDTRTYRIANSCDAIAGWLDGLAEPSQRRVIFEASGRYDRHLIDVLDQYDVAFSRVNPARARHFAKSVGLNAKTDSIDARMLAAMGQSLNPPTTPRTDSARETLTRVHLRRDQLVAMRQKEKVRLMDADEEERESLTRHIAWLDAEIAAIEVRRDDLLRDNDELARLNRLLRSIPGIGPVAATTLLAMMPELGAVSPKAAASLAGLAPFNVDSGRFRGHRAIRGGRRRVRNALYMAAVTASRSKTRFAVFADQMQKRGKPFKLTIIALARKMLVTANVVVRDGTPFAA